MNKKVFRHYLYFLAGQQFSMFGSLIVGFTITWWITIETGSAVFLSLSTFLMFIPQIVVTPIAGVLADRWSRKIMIIISDSMQALATFLLFVIFLGGFQSLWFILAINTFRAALGAFQLPAVQSLIPTMVPKENLSRINGLNFLMFGVIFSIGPVIAALLLSIFTIEQIFLLDIFTFIIALIPLIIVKIPKVNQKTEETNVKKSFLNDFKEGFSIIKMVPGLFALIVFAMIWNFIFRPWNVLLPYFVVYTHNGSALNLAMLLMSFQIANIIGSLITMIKKDFKHKIKINIIGASLFFVGQIPAILAPTGNFLVMMISMFAGALIFPITVATYMVILQTVVPKDKIGRVMSLDHMISMAIAPLGALISGSLSEVFGIVNLLLICAIIGLIYPSLIWIFTKIRQLEVLEQNQLNQIRKTVEIEEVAEII
ncbi:hypothetical protein LCGC14_1033750 [marine sediment metagenome]|uniref:Major facilitator superfamily (MFS) profile domain-containing protein n=1 Tax=marine sediment metagenome TaxID=412755 RepID=A0A0F9QZT5_9ZZZZ